MCSMTRTFIAVGCCMLVLLNTIPNAYAALTISTTRLVYNSEQRNLSVVIANPSQHLYAGQAWVNTQSDDTTTFVPIIATPALFKLAPGKERTVRLSSLPNNLPTDRESLFFFNLQEIPAAQEKQKNTLTIALRTRIKLFYRPSQLTVDPIESLKALRFSIPSVNHQRYLRVHNPTPFHYTFSRLDLSDADQRYSVPDADMISPMSEHDYPLPAGISLKGLNVVFSVINDYGGNSSSLTLPVQTTP
ncbi:molecular chaperone [Pseudomonas guariconensis]|nr:molecular chaperone [Pseudomonas guariconensis]MBF8791888.1 molecular chaperone [Pseudomonas monteilii]